MKGVLPWFLTVALLAASVGLFLSNQKQSRELASLRAEGGGIEQLRAELEVTQNELSARNADVLRLKRDNEDVLRLRNESRQLRERNQELQAELQKALAATEQVSLRMQSQSEQTRHIFQTSACIAILRQLDAIKHQWAVDNNKTAESVPMVQDLLPLLPNNTMPTCPSGGTYSLNAAGLPPTCSIPGHVLPE